MKNLQENEVQGSRNSLPNSGGKWNQTSIFSPSESGVLLKESQILMDSLATEPIADVRGLSTAAIKVESASPPVSTAECVSEVFQADHKQSTNTHSHTAGRETIPRDHAGPSHIHNIHIHTGTIIFIHKDIEFCLKYCKLLS